MKGNGRSEVKGVGSKREGKGSKLNVVCEGQVKGNESKEGKGTNETGGREAAWKVKGTAGRK